jgi:hypothetical protein
MRKLRSSASIASAVVLLAGAMTLTATANAKPGHHGKAAHTLKLWAQETQSNSLDLGETGTTLGDREVFTDDLSRSKGGDAIGYDGADCTIVRIDEAAYATTLQCVATLALPGGQLTTQGLVTFGQSLPDAFTFAITGGTGKFKDATGSVRIRLLSETLARYKITWRRA